MDDIRHLSVYKTNSAFIGNCLLCGLPSLFLPFSPLDRHHLVIAVARINEFQASQLDPPAVGEFDLAI
ncbi:hypothetical protein BC936DRAFT_149182 [Jimgerdemannia flammicorona]|uniref:Uncharacterized protein n=1 Tax=Jimgerdemannia flammicorona TaxID=994334 RepID=A0A433D1D1_9FUNG|nr:hypothetical protein BC936DRAFT_149182 [Jimgerdemannia flammicorona]